jgi:hypothetical protein
MIDVATGGPRIQEVNDEYRERRSLLRKELGERRLEDPSPFVDLWAWYSRWSSGDLPSYQSRRLFIAELYEPVIRAVEDSSSGQMQEPTGWARVDRTVTELRSRLASARTEEQYQSVGLLCRETLISLAQEVYDPKRHLTVDRITASHTDAKRMLEAYIAIEVRGRSNSEARKHAKAALDLANRLQHNRTADFREAALCVEASTSVVNIIAILSGRRDPEP